MDLARATPPIIKGGHNVSTQLQHCDYNYFRIKRKYDFSLVPPYHLTVKETKTQLGEFAYMAACHAGSSGEYNGHPQPLMVTPLPWRFGFSAYRKEHALGVCYCCLVFLYFLQKYSYQEVQRKPRSYNLCMLSIFCFMYILRSGRIAIHYSPPFLLTHFHNYITREYE